MRNLVEGETKAVDVTLYDGEGVSRTAIDGTGMTVTMDLRDRVGASVPYAGKVNWLVASAGTVRYTPAATDLRAVNSPYGARFLVTDGSGNIGSYPNGEADKWVVRK